MLVRIVFGKLLSGHVFSEGQTLERMAWGKKTAPRMQGVWACWWSKAIWPTSK